MKTRIAIWAGIGLAVVGLWNLYILSIFPTPINAVHPLLWTLVQITCPLAFASFHFHFPASIYLVLLTNAVSYALLGMAAEAARKSFRHAHASA